ncbi:MAG: GtrA family protein [Coriobacteriaceae bacterium]|nr:GtrA family protein [Coriobacteriaceae bacterium]
MSALAKSASFKQFVRFAVVGLLSLAVEYTCLLLLVEGMGVNFLAGTTIAFIVSIIFNYILSMKYVFVHKDGLTRKREFTIFAILSAIGLGLNDLYMYVGVTIFNIGYQAMKLISTFLVTWYNFFSRRKFLSQSAS